MTIGKEKYPRGPAGANLFISGLGPEDTNHEIKTLFSLYGNVLSCVVLKQKYGFVSYDNPESARNAISALDGLASPDGTRRLTVTLKKEPAQ